MPERFETGPLQFEGDHPGIFIRGDNALSMAMYLEQAAELLRGMAYNQIALVSGRRLYEMAGLLRGCDAHGELPGLQHVKTIPDNPEKAEEPSSVVEAESGGRSESVRSFDVARLKSTQCCDPVIDGLLGAAIEEIERLRQTIARLTFPGITRAPWFYAPCSNCGAIEGMGLTTPKVDGTPMPGHTSVWCAHCEHFGPPVPTNPTDSKESDRAATVAWNREFAAAFASIERMQGSVVKALAKEREACAKIAEGRAAERSIVDGDRIYRNGWCHAAERIAQLIRARTYEEIGFAEVRKRIGDTADTASTPATTEKPDPTPPLQVPREDSVEMLGGTAHLPEEFRQVARLANQAGLEGLTLVDVDYGIDTPKSLEALEFHARIKLSYREKAT
jgi:hypothetical protein